jgi:hypothetical protein
MENIPSGYFDKAMNEIKIADKLLKSRRFWKISW